jgi:MFS family permease
MAAGYAVYAADRTVLASVLVPLSSSLKLSGVQQGLMLSAQYIGVLSVVLAAGHLSDRFGKWRIILLGVVVFSVFTWMIALSANFYEAFAFRLLSGVGEGVFWPVAMSAVANYFGGNRGLALGTFYVGFDVGGAGGSSIGGYTFSLTGDWRTAFYVAPLLGIAVVAGLFMAQGAFSRANTKVGMLAIGRDALALLKRRRVLLIMLFAFAATYPVATWQSYLAKYWNNVFGVSVPIAAYGYSAVLISGGIGKVALGRSSDRWARNVILLAGSAGAAVMFGLFFYVNSVVLGFLFALAASFLASALFPVMQALASDSCDGKTGTALGLTTTFQSVATVISPILTAILFPQGVAKAIALNVVVPMALVAIVALFLRDPRRGPSPAGLRAGEPR